MIHDLTAMLTAPSQRMQGLCLEDGPVLRLDLRVPTSQPLEALVRVRLAGVCGTDLALLRGYAHFRGVLGHEFVGEVAAAADAPELVGKRVVGEINIVCGRCLACRAGRSNHCERREVLGIRGRDGAFAEYLTLPLANLHPVQGNRINRHEYSKMVMLWFLLAAQVVRTAACPDSCHPSRRAGACWRCRAWCCRW